MRYTTTLISSLSLIAATTGCGAPHEEVEETVAEETDAILSGTTLTTESSNDRRRPGTVRIRNMTIPAACPGKVGLGSGTLLENNVVLTARHVVANYTSGCVQSNAPAAPSQIYVYAEDSAQQPTSCSAGSCAKPKTGGVLFEPTGSDTALLLLSGDVRGYQDSTFSHFVPMYVYDPARYFGNNMSVTGYGVNACDGTTSGTLRVGTSVVSGWGPTQTVVEFVPGSSGQLPSFGDSGGPGWSASGNESFPRAAYGIHSNTVCPLNVRSVSPHIYRHWARTQIANSKSNITYLFGTGMTTNEPYWVRDEPENASNVSNWYQENGRLYEVTNVHGRKLVNGVWEQNYPDGAMLIPSFEIHESVFTSINVQSTDNDAAGIVFRYVDPTHFYLFTIRQESGQAHIYKRKGSTFTVLASTARSVNWSVAGGVNLEVRAQDYTYRAYVNGTLILTTTDTEYPVGAVGIYKYGLVNASFDSFNVNPEPPIATGHWPAP